MLANSHILIVEDDPVASTTLSAYISKEGYRVSTAPDGETMRELFAKGDVDLILLDISLPDEDGFSLLREVRRQSEVGVIMVTGKAEDVDRIVALEMGADDYVVKPFNMRELFARTKNLLRRTQLAHVVRKDEAVKRFSGWTLNIPRRTLMSPTGDDVRLTMFEFELLAALCQNAGRVMTRDSLMDHVSGRDRAANDRTIDVLVGRLRRKLEATPADPRIIVTVQGVGYVLAGEG
ncbi:response regulator [Rhodoferax sp. U2-2l]|uniref:response regulator n=1 Tax=Rhodoferax sp. U2-2l TaxID=2884000 RepID=UPI001D0A45B3|nr:response regulator [Rhodoferax sp. U2-2l]MCB8745427.1 response regulator [Rhodoferax sp. U2-2l]